MKRYVYICDKRIRNANFSGERSRNRLEELSNALFNNNYTIKGIYYNMSSFLLFLKRVISNEKYAIVFDERFLLLGICLKLKGNTLVFCPRGNKLEHFKHYYSKTRLKIYRYIFSALYRSCDKMIFQTQTQQEEFERLYNYDVRSIVVPNNVNASWMQDIHTDQNFPQKPTCNRIGFLGGDNPRKGATLLLDAFNILKDINPEIKLVIGGAYKNPPDLERVDFMGYVSDIKEFFNTIDLLVIPSDYDSFPNTLLEALAANKPFLVSETPIISEIVENKERLLFPLEAKKLADKMNILYQHQDIWEKTINDCKMLKSRYTFNWGEAMIDAIESSNTE